MARQYGQNTEKGRIAQAQKIQELEEETLFRKKVERYISFGLLVVGVLFIVGGIITAGRYNLKAEETRKELQATQAELADLQNAKADDTTTLVEVETASASAADAGQAVCVAQNDLNAAIKAEEIAGMSTLSEAHQDALNRLRMYFIKGSGNSNMIRGTWCKYGNWEFNGVYEFEGNTITVVWKCYAPDDVDKERLLAFLKADYDSQKNVFTHGELRLTSWYKTLADSYGDLTMDDQDPSWTEPTDHYDPSADNSSGDGTSSQVDTVSPTVEDEWEPDTTSGTVTVHTSADGIANSETNNISVTGSETSSTSDVNIDSNSTN